MVQYALCDWKIFLQEHGLVEHPLNGSVEKNCVWEVGDLAVEPEMDAGDRGGLKVREFFAQILRLQRVGQQLGKGIEWDGQYRADRCGSGRSRREL